MLKIRNSLLFINLYPRHGMNRWEVCIIIHRRCYCGDERLNRSPNHTPNQVKVYLEALLCGLARKNVANMDMTRLDKEESDKTKAYATLPCHVVRHHGSR